MTLNNGAGICVPHGTKISWILLLTLIGSSFMTPVTSLIKLNLSIGRCRSFHPQRRSRESLSSHLFFSGKSNNGNDDVNKSLQEKINQFLDTSIFDPSKMEENDDSINPLAKWFANLTKKDYGTAKALYSAAFITFMIIVSEELFRWQLYGINYVPFHSGGRYGGTIF